MRYINLGRTGLKVSRPQLDQAIAALDITLPADECHELEGLYEPPRSHC